MSRKENPMPRKVTAPYSGEEGAAMNLARANWALRAVTQFANDTRLNIAPEADGIMMGIRDLLCNLAHLAEIHSINEPEEEFKNALKTYREERAEAIAEDDARAADDMGF